MDEDPALLLTIVANGQHLSIECLVGGRWALFYQQRIIAYFYNRDDAAAVAALLTHVALTGVTRVAHQAPPSP